MLMAFLIILLILVCVLAIEVVAFVALLMARAFRCIYDALMKLSAK